MFMQHMLECYESIHSDVSERRGAKLPLTSEALATLACEAIELVYAGASVLAGAGQTVVPVQVTVFAHPPWLTVTAVPGERAGRGQDVCCTNTVTAHDLMKN